MNRQEEILKHEQLLNFPEAAIYFLFSRWTEQEIEYFFQDRQTIKLPPKEPKFRKVTEIRVNNNSDVPICFKLMDRVGIHTFVIAEHYVGPGGFFNFTALPQEKLILNGNPEVICGFDNYPQRKVEWNLGIEEHMGPLMRRGIFTTASPNKLIPMLGGTHNDGWFLK